MTCETLQLRKQQHVPVICTEISPSHLVCVGANLEFLTRSSYSTEVKRKYHKSNLVSSVNYFQNDSRKKTLNCIVSKNGSMRYCNPLQRSYDMIVLKGVMQSVSTRSTSFWSVYCKNNKPYIPLYDIMRYINRFHIKHKSQPTRILKNVVQITSLGAISKLTLLTSKI